MGILWAKFQIMSLGFCSCLFANIFKAIQYILITERQLSNRKQAVLILLIVLLGISWDEKNYPDSPTEMHEWLC